MEVSNSYIHTVLPSTHVSQVTQFCPVDQSVSQQIGRSLHFIWVREEENCSSSDLNNFLAMNSSKKKTTKRSKKLFSGGCWVTSETWSQALKTSQSSVNIIMSLILQLLPIDWGLVSKSPMNFQRISQRFSMRNFTNSIRISFQRHSICIRLLALSMSPSPWFHHSLKLPCPLFKLPSSHQHSKNCLLRV